MDSQIKPDFIGIGAQKCASTWVYRVLKDHPEVYVSEQKELNYFSYYYDRGHQWYINHFAEKTEANKAGEISTSYLCDPRAPLRAYSYNPDLQVIVTLRDPVERAFSNHLHEIRIKQYTGPDYSFEAGMENNPMYLEQSFYSAYLKQWMDYFPEEQIIVLLLEEIREDPQREACRLYRFLGIDQDHLSEFLYRKANPSNAEKHQGFDRSLRLFGNMARRLGLTTLVQAVKSNSTIYGIRDSNRIHLSETIPAMKAETETYLTAELTDGVMELVSLLNRSDLPWPIWERIKNHGRAMQN